MGQNIDKLGESGKRAARGNRTSVHSPLQQQDVAAFEKIELIQ